MRHGVVCSYTTTTYPRDRCVHELFEAQALRRPDDIALVDDSGTMSYAALNSHANRLAHYLRSCGLQAGAIVGICLPRGFEMVSAILAVLKAGAGYLPLDAADPTDRLMGIVDNAKPAFILSAGRLSRRLSSSAAPVIALDADAEAIAGQDDGNLPASASPASLCYVMYTSGSTGTPKGVMVGHRAVVRLVCGVDYIEFSGRRTFVQLAPICFDASTFELWGALLHGARLVLAPDGMLDADRIASLIERHGVCTLWLTAGLFHTLVEVCPRIFRNLSQLIVGGDAISARHVRLVDKELPSHARLVNGYGPTEGTTFTCCYSVPRPLPAAIISIPIGRPIANTRVYVIDEDLRRAGTGATGELYIGGDGLAQGYLDDAHLTAEKFIANPLPDAPDERVYRTGDRVRVLSDGNLEFLGRLDDQVKIHGHRVEPGEVERALLRHPGMGSCAVIAQTLSEGGKQLVGYYVVVDEPGPAVAEVRTHLRNLLPEYMLPSALVKLAALPLKSNGKVDRDALPSPDTAPGAGSASSLGLQSPAERAMAELWGEVLGIPTIGGHDHFFFDLNGNSLVAMQLIDRVNRRCGVRLAVHDLLNTPTVVAMCAAIARRTRRTPSVRYLTVVRDGRYGNPVVCVGFSTILPQLQAALPPDSPLWWLKLDGFDAPPYVMRSIAATADSYVDELSRVAATRITVIGHSYCGLLAFELARRLRSTGAKVDVMLLEPALPLMFAADHHGMSRGILPSQGFADTQQRAKQKRPTGDSSITSALRSAAQWAATRVTRRFRKSVLKPCLQISVKLGRELPPKYRNSWYYGEQMAQRIKQFDVTRIPGTIWLAGQPAYLAAYAPSWRALVDGNLELCPLSAAHCHTDILQYPSAAEWLSVVNGWVTSNDIALPLDRVA